MRCKGERVPPLLAGRLDKAAQFYFRQARRTQPPCLIVCGGKGEGEDIPEAEAMARYLREKGIPEQDIRREDQSTNTYENLRNAKDIMDSAMERYRCALVTSNYHLFRAALLSHKVGIRRCRGLGKPNSGILSTQRIPPGIHRGLGAAQAVAYRCLRHSGFDDAGSDGMMRRGRARAMQKRYCGLR